MYAQQNSTTSYGHGASPIKTTRSIEFDALAHVTRQLRSSCVGPEVDFNKTCAAIHLNRQLWNTLAADVSNPENGLSEELKSQIFFLSEFVNQHSRGVLKKVESADALIDINVSIMRGLLPEGNI